MIGFIETANRPVAVRDRPSRRSLLPREHGGYGQLALPLVATLATGRPTAAAGLLALAAALAFVGHEPLLVVTGHRGPRAHREHGRRALFRLGQLGAGALLTAGTAVALMPATLPALAIAAGCATLALLFALCGRERTLIGEGVAASALAAAALPVAIACAVPLARALLSWLTWSLGFAAVTCAVRVVVARPTRKSIGPVALLALLAAVLAVLRPSPGLAALPLVVTAAGIAACPPPPRRLRQIGWALLGVSTVTATLMALLPAGR